MIFAATLSNQRKTSLQNCLEIRNLDSIPENMEYRVNTETGVHMSDIY